MTTRGVRARQAEIEALVLHGQPLVVDFQHAPHRCVQVAHMDEFLHGLVA